MRRMIVLVSVLGLLGAACATDTPSEGTGPATRAVQVDGSPDGYKGYALKYFPSQVTVRPGDTVRFEQVFTGEPHSVTLGTLVDDVIPAAREIGPEEEPPAELVEKMEALPSMLPEGPGDANQVAVNPCFVESGDLPEDPEQACPEVEQPEFDGTQAYYSSGFLPPDEDFEVKLSEDIQPGSYSFYCNLHGPSMSGDIEVVAAGTEIPSDDEVAEARDRELAETFEPLDAAYEQAKEGTPFGNLAGFGSEESESTGIMEFIPEEIEAEAGDKVTWTVFGPHTITFDPPSDVGYPLVKGPDDRYHVNPDAMGPAGGPGMPEPPEGEPPATEGPPTPTEIDGGSWDGEGFHSSGFLFSIPVPGMFFSYSLTFTEPGDYSYVCLIHPAMTGTVKVT